MSNNTIWKFTVPVTDSQQIKIEGATLVEILDAKKSNPEQPLDSPKIDIWAVVSPWPGSVEFVPIEIRGTGHPLNEERFRGSTRDAHIATVLDGPFVWHVFHGRVFD